MKNDGEQPMKSELSNAYSMSVSAGKDGDASKLMSLLALASAALAMPQTGNADIIFTDLSANAPTVGTNASPSFIITNLPGTARLGFEAQHVQHTSIHQPASARWVSAFQSKGYVRLKTHSSFVVPVGRGLTWDQIPGPIVQTTFGEIGQFLTNLKAHFPDSFDHMYLPFIFKDSTQVGSPLRYGWVEISLLNLATGPGPEVTIFGYAYDDTGAHLATGVVPEPASITLLALGALALGAKGLRSWRRNRPAANPVGMAR